MKRELIVKVFLEFKNATVRCAFNKLLFSTAFIVRRQNMAQHHINMIILLNTILLQKPSSSVTLAVQVSPLNLHGHVHSSWMLHDICRMSVYSQNNQPVRQWIIRKKVVLGV